jgi:hypothetical protein
VFDGALNGARFRAAACPGESRGRADAGADPDPAAGRYRLAGQSEQPSGGRCHRGEAITAHGAPLVYLPPDSPDLNPIEQAFAKFKAALRKAAERTGDGLRQTIGRTLDLFSPQQCRNFFKQAGYAI